MIRTGYNRTSAPIVVDAEGRTIGGREWGTYDSTEDAAQAAIKARDLIPLNIDIATASNPSATAQAAFARTEQVKQRAEQVKALDKDVLHETAVESGLIAPADEPSVSDLRATVAEAIHVPVPEPDPKPKTTKRTSRNQED